jgi:hypothetical protein
MLNGGEGGDEIKKGKGEQASVVKKSKVLRGALRDYVRTQGSATFSTCLERLSKKYHEVYVI